jgi:DNA-directed RNA polymerase specialized sigma24 family protein
LTALETLIEAGAAGDRVAFAAFYDAAAPQLFGLALDILKRRDWAEDVLQEALLSAWRNAGDYRRELGSARTWLTEILRNRALDRLRRETAAGLAGTGDDAPGMADPAPSALTPADSIAPVAPPAGLRARLLAEIAPPLPPGQRPFNMMRWLAWTFGLSALAGIVAIALVFVFTPRPPEIGGYALLHRTDSAAHDVVAFQIDKQRREMVALANAVAPQPGHDYELWVLPPDKPPLALGVVKAGARQERALPAAAAGYMTEFANLAITVEPAGGSPSGAPSGPIVFVGMLRIMDNPTTNPPKSK